MKKFIAFVIFAIVSSVTNAGVIGKLAANNGVVTCARPMIFMENFLFSESSYSTELLTPATKPDTNAAMTITSHPSFTGGVSHTITYSANTVDGKCATGYATTYVVESSCSTYREKLTDFKFAGSLNDTTAILETGKNSARFYLTQLSSYLCMVTKVERITSGVSLK